MDMNPGDLVLAEYILNACENPYEFAVCLDPNIVTCHNQHESFKVIKMLKPNGEITYYPVEHWNFQVINETR